MGKGNIDYDQGVPGNRYLRFLYQQRQVCLALVIVLLCMFCSMCMFPAGGYGGAETAIPNEPTTPAAFRKALRPKPIPEDWSFTIISTGDIMMHSPQTRAGWREASRDYDFTFMFEKIAPILQSGDLVIGNLETPLAGVENGGFTGYPLFNAPEILANNLKEAGFTLLSTANNHSLDRRYQGLLRTLDHLDEAGLMHTGTYRTPDEQEHILRFEVKNVKIAAIAATYGTNGLLLPEEHRYAVNYIDEKNLYKDISRARSEGAQYIIILLHWGEEYQNKPSKEQISLAENLLHAGADLILGNHPHVLQRGEMIHVDREDGSPGIDRFVMYSQGNLVSNQDGLDRLCNMLLKLTVRVDGASGQPYLSQAGYIPIYTQRRSSAGVSKHTVWPVELAMDALETSGKQLFGEQDRAAIPKAWERVQQSQPELAIIPLMEYDKTVQKR